MCSVGGKTAVDSAAAETPPQSPPYMQQAVTSSQLDPDTLMQLKIQKKRALEAERKKRIFDPKTRIMGVDTAALDAQVQERAERERREHAEQMQADQQMLYYTSMIKLQTREAQRMRFEREKAVKDFNLQYMSKASRKERNSSSGAHDATGKQGREQWMRELMQTGDDAPVSSLLRLDGEDRGYEERVRFQRAQQRQWADEQKFLLELANQREKEEQLLYDEQALRMTALAEGLEARRRLCQKEQEHAAAKMNKILAAQRAQREDEDRRRDELLKQQEISKNIHSLLLTEGRMNLIKDDQAFDAKCPLMKSGVMGKNRDGFKGLDPAVKQNIIDGNLEQWKTIQERRDAQTEEERKWNRQSEVNRKLSVALHREQLRMRRAKEEEVKMINDVLAKQQNQQREYLEKAVYTGHISDEFYDYFGTTTR